MQNTPFTSEHQRKQDIREKLLLSYRKLILESLPLTVERAIKDAEVKLMLSVNESMDGMLRSDFSVSLQMLETRSHWLSDKVSKDVVSALVNISGKKGQAAVSGDKNIGKSLSVVEKDDFEDWLAMNSAIRLVQENLGYELNRLCYVFETISGSAVDLTDCPVGPARIVSAFQEGCSLLDVPSSSYPIIYKVLGGVLKSELKDIYGVLLSAAERYGINGTSHSEADSFSVRRESRNRAEGVEGNPLQAKYAVQNDLNQANQSESNLSDNAPLMADEELFDSPSSSSSRVGSNAYQGAGSSTRSQGDTFSTLQTLINLKASVSGGGVVTVSADSIRSGSAETRPSYFQQGDVVEAVNQLQSLQLKELSVEDAHERAGISKGSDNRARSSNVIELPLKDIVKKRLNENGNAGTQLGVKDNELIDITDRLFETLLEQVGVSHVLKKWLKRLKLSVLKVVLLDDSFFSDHNHPARQVINQLARLAGTKRTPNRSVERSLEYFTGRIVNEYTGDLKLFEELLIEINHLVSRQEEAFKRNAERVARAYDGQQRLIEARETVVAEIDQRIRGKKIPKVLLSLLDEGGWRQLMLVTLLREGADSERFRESLSVVDQLLAWLGDTPEGSASVGDSLEKDLEAPTFLTMIDRELRATGQTSHGRIIGKLKEYLVEGKKARLFPAEPYTWVVKSDQEYGAAASSPIRNEENKPSNSRWHKRARMMVIGDWIEIIDEDNVAQRMRLAWSGSKSFRFVFVDSQGMKDIDMSLDELADRMDKGKATLLDKEEVPVIDQGLH